MRAFVATILLATIALASPAYADPYDGYFIAQKTCPAFQSFNTQTNPGNILVQVGHSYEIIERNRPSKPSHFRLIVPGVSPEERWVAVGCGTRTVAEGEQLKQDEGSSLIVNPVPTQPVTWNVLAASWQPAFCETRDAWTENNELKPECATQTPDRFDATHFALHGLWPQPFDPSSEYCGFSASEITALKRREWPAGTTIVLDAPTRTALTTVMPGLMSALEFHEWFKHGTCYGKSQDAYFDDALLLMEKLNATGLDEYFVSNLGKRVGNDDIRAQFDSAFGKGAGDRVGVACTTEWRGNRTILTELRIHMKGAVTEAADLGALIRAGDIATNDSCDTDMVIDPVGL